MSTLYVRAPLRQSVGDILRNDVERKYLANKLRTPDFYTNEIRWFDSTRSKRITAENIDSFMYEWETKSQNIVSRYGQQKVVAKMYQKCEAEVSDKRGEVASCMPACLHACMCVGVCFMDWMAEQTNAVCLELNGNMQKISACLFLHQTPAVESSLASIVPNCGAVQF